MKFIRDIISEKRAQGMSGGQADAAKAKKTFVLTGDLMSSGRKSGDSGAGNDLLADEGLDMFDVLEPGAAQDQARRERLTGEPDVDEEAALAAVRALAAAREQAPAAAYGLDDDTDDEDDYEDELLDEPVAEAEEWSDAAEDAAEDDFEDEYEEDFDETAEAEDFDDLEEEPLAAEDDFEEVEEVLAEAEEDDEPEDGPFDRRETRSAEPGREESLAAAAAALAQMRAPREEAPFGAMPQQSRVLSQPRPERGQPVMPRREFATDSAEAVATGPVDVPAPAAGRAARRAGRVKTRLLGFNPAEHRAPDPFGARADTVEEVAEEEVQITPTFPVGWLIVVSGPGRGAAIALQNGVAQIGRGAGQGVRLDFGDNAISRENHAAVAYDSESRKFYLGHGGKANLVRLNNRPVLSTEELLDGNLIRIGETTLLFKALCGEAFDWSEGQEGATKHVSFG